MEITSNSTLEDTLNAFIADEHIASTQYKMAKVVAKGKALNFADKIFDENGDEEDEHFDELVTYAQSLNIPVQVNPSQMETNCTTPFVDITDGDSTAQLVSILISAEKKAIAGYEIALRNEAIVAEHPELTQFFGELLNDERGHLKELEDVMSNIEGSNTVTTAAEQQPVQVITTEEPSMQPVADITMTFGESVDRTNTISLLESVSNGRVDSDAMLRNLTSFLMEESVRKVVDENDYFNVETVNLVLPDDERCCTSVLLEMVEDGMLDSKHVLADMLDSMSDEDVKVFGESFGYIGSHDDEIDTEPTMLSESGLSFQDIFNNVISE